MIITGLVANGQTVVEKTQYVDRGYENIVEKLSALGADISRVPADPTETVANAG